MHSITPNNPAVFSENTHLTFDLAPNETGKLVKADMPEAPMVEGNYRVEFDIYTGDGELLPVPDGWERLYATFEIRHLEDDPTTLLAPENEEIIYTTTPTLKWEAVANAAVYRAVLSDNSSFSGLDDDGSGTTACVDSSCQTIKVDAPTTRYTIGQNDKNGDKIRLGETTILKFTFHDRLDERFQQKMYDAALRDALERSNIATQVMSSIPMSGVVDHYDRRKAIRALSNGDVVIFSAGTGNPMFTTDSSACLRGIEVQADVVLKATKVDGVYSADPMKVADAVKYDELSFDEVIRRDETRAGTAAAPAAPPPVAGDPGARAEARLAATGGWRPRQSGMPLGGGAVAEVFGQLAAGTGPEPPVAVAQDADTPPLGYALAQLRHAGNGPLAAHDAADAHVLGRLLPQFAVLAHPPQQQFCFVLRKFAVHEGRNLHFYCIIHCSPPFYRTRVPTFLPIASRALKILDRTVPTGQSMVCAISS